MNKERILDVADMIENDRLPGVRFDMSFWGVEDYAQHECGTSACIAGYTLIAAYGVERFRELFSLGIGGIGDSASKARKILGLSELQARRLFHGKMHASPEDAARVLRRLAKTGKVDWS